MRYFYLFISIILFCILGLTTLPAQIPQTLSYQGVLTDSSGAPKPDGAYSFTFRLYETLSGGAAIWSETENLAVKRGLFNTVLGDQSAFEPAAKFDRAYWLGIQVENDPELSPRIPLTSVGYSFRAIRADTADIALVSAVDSTWKTSGSDIYRLYGNVGLGTLNPETKLHIDARGVFGTTQLRLENSHVTGSVWDFSINKNNVPRAYLDIANTLSLEATTGNVGIGTSNPQAKLDVFSGNSANDVLRVRSNPSIFNQGGIIHHQSSQYAWQEVARGTGSANNGTLA